MRRAFSNPALTYGARWAAVTLVFNLAWETAHVRLYTLWNDPDRWYVWQSVLHCTLGDVVIGTTAFGFAAWLLARVDWPIHRPRVGTAIVIASGTVFTVWSEWNNVYRLRLWDYAPAMPTIFGVGVSPLLQWVVLPPLIVLTVRMLDRRRPIVLK